MLAGGLILVSTFGWIVIVAVLSLLALAWIVSIFAIVLDRISFGAKVLWFVAVTVLAPFAIPAYFIARGRRRRRERELKPRHAGGW